MLNESMDKKLYASQTVVWVWKPKFVLLALAMQGGRLYVTTAWEVLLCSACGFIHSQRAWQTTALLHEKEARFFYACSFTKELAFNILPILHQKSRRPRHICICISWVRSSRAAAKTAHRPRARTGRRRYELQKDRTRYCITNFLSMRNGICNADSR